MEVNNDQIYFPEVAFSNLQVILGLKRLIIRQWKFDKIRKV